MIDLKPLVFAVLLAFGACGWHTAHAAGHHHKHTLRSPFPHAMHLTGGHHAR